MVDFFTMDYFKNNIIYLNIKPIYKNEIMLKQEQIFLKLKEILGKKTPTALRWKQNLLRFYCRQYRKKLFLSRLSLLGCLNFLG